MQIIRDLKIKHKLLILLFILLIPLLYFVVENVREEIAKIRILEEELVQLEESEKISELIHELQQERAKINPAAEGDSIFLLEAQAQRVMTDGARKRLEAFLKSTGRTVTGLSQVDELNRYRDQLDRKALDISAFRTYSNKLLADLTGHINDNTTSIGNVKMNRRLLSYGNLVDAKVQLGVIRSVLMKASGKENISYKDYALFSSQKDDYDNSLSAFRRHAVEQALADVDALTSTQHYKEMMRVLQALEGNPQFNLAAYDPEQIYNLLSKSVGDFRNVENSMISRIRGELLEEQRSKVRGLIVLLSMIVIALGLAILLSFYIINFISGSLALLKAAADRVRLGATDVSININSEDEIGKVAESFRGVVEKNLSLSRVAQAIGQGNYDMAVEVQSPEDVLSLSIREMKENLRLFTRENESRNWILTGISELNNLVSGEVRLEELSKSVIDFMCRYSGSEVGVLYLNNQAGQLVPAAANGLPQAVEELDSFRIGVGKVGQAASEQQVKILDEIFPEHMKIKTSFSEIDPATIIILPLIFSSDVVGAIELCSRKKYTPLQQEFFRVASERIAIIVHSLKAQLQTQELLYQTQNQSEELETQQEELRQMNAELRASEEELKVNQEELQEKNAELEEKAQLLEEQYEALDTKNKALEDARQAIELKVQQVETVSKYKSDFLANMSHELRTPLNSILILSRLLSDNPEKTLSEKQAEHARIIHKSGADLLKLINEILDLSKIESGMIRLEREEIQIQELGLEATFKELAKDKEVDFGVSYAPGLDTLTTDRFRLEQILKNFLSNAFKFTEAGGSVNISVYPLTEKQKRKRSQRLQEYDEVIAFAVKDTGIGVPKEKQEMIFEAFQQADTSTTRKYGGTGLGLAISRELAALLGGEIALESQPGVGSTFTLYLPKEADQKVVQQPLRPAAPPVIEQRKTDAVKQAMASIQVPQQLNGEQKEVSLLIVDDDKGFSDILVDFALAKSFRVLQAYTGNEGLRLAREHKPDALLLDINLPDISGWDVLRQIREDQELRHINVHVMSAYDRDVTAHYQENEEYLPKPVTLEMINTAFSTMTELSHKPIESILIVEDNEIENKAVAELLLAHGIKSTSAYSAEEAEQLLGRHKVDCVVLDLNLPGMKGYEWMQKIRRKKGMSELPIIVYSGKDLSEDEEVKLKEFANTIIIKNEYSYLRLLDEVQLFLHKVNQKLPTGNAFKMKLHVPEEVLKGKKALIVDDDVRNLYSLSSLLEGQGMKMVMAYNGREALEKLQTEKEIDMVLMDVMMPEMDGIEAIKHIRQNPQFKQLPIIALTAKAMKEDREKCLQAGASDYIPKPVDTDKLLTLMRVWMYEV